MRKGRNFKKVYTEVKSFKDIVDGKDYLVNYNGTEFESKLYAEGESFACEDVEHGMRIKFKEQNMDLGHISLKSIEHKGKAK